MNWIHGSMMNLTGLYHAIRNATGTAVTKPIRKPSNTEIKLLPISLNSKPLETIVWMEPITLIAFGKHLDVLYCIGENADEQPRWQEVLKEQLTVGLEGVDKSKVTIAYEPVWAIGPGKIPPDADYIRKIASYVKEVTDGMDVVYGGGLKTDNAKMLASVKEIDGGLIALTRFSGEIGFYPDEYLEIIKTYLGY